VVKRPTSAWQKVVSTLGNIPYSSVTALIGGSHALVTGVSGGIHYLKVTPTTVQFTSTGQNQTTQNLNDLAMSDNLTCFAVGSSGALIKGSYMGTWNYNTQGQFTYSNVATGWSWNLLNPASQVFNNQNTSAQFALTTIGMTGPYTGFFGATYNSQSQSCRRLTDMSNKFSTFFWYDKLGRIVLSQNTKQHNRSTPEYSYTIYDALGRVSEAGVKRENTGALTVASIYGAYVGGAFNPDVIETVSHPNNPSEFQTWLDAGTASNLNSTRTEVTRTQYDAPLAINYSTNPLPANFSQQFLRKRVAAVYYQDIYGPQITADNYSHATHYTYDIHGNVNQLVQDNPLADKTALGTAINNISESQRFKMLEYNYDLISGNVHSVSYQRGKADAWHHAYFYDADNRITEVYTSRHPDPITLAGATETNAVSIEALWDLDARYIYYHHGPLARVELGQNQVQGVDYAYTLQGWLKGVNGNSLSGAYDIGRDSEAATANANRYFAKDVFAFSLQYFQGDYQPIATAGANRFASLAGSDIVANSEVTTNT
jgi:hypothetical protein